MSDFDLLKEWKAGPQEKVGERGGEKGKKKKRYHFSLGPVFHGN